MYLTTSRPDIMFVVCACGRFQVTPKMPHLHAVKRIFRYLKGQPKLGLWYPRDSPFDLEAFSDIANSTTEAEYVAAANYYGQVLWIQNQMLDYGFNFMNTKIYIDNESAICIVKNLVFHSKTKHIEIRYHFIRDSYEKRLIQVIKIHTGHNVADLLTKAFNVSRFKFLVASIGMLLFLYLVLNAPNVKFWTLFANSNELYRLVTHTCLKSLDTLYLQLIHCLQALFANFIIKSKLIPSG
ncbi:hypothetical protein Tco_0480352 [Tanacetum coccineum]